MNENVREKLTPILDFISTKYIAENYFEKTPQWFYQRLNGNQVNGKTASFTDDEIETLNFALKDISKKISLINLE
ncbi:Uncharacterised protein [Candidatus Ornithobacterium hominis]|uniref:DUF5053 domain-containing protein n=1 Tax=Candidatus Ornithobacterium hominis TaxID=2497989 RepID=UPI000E5A703D|nr:DUF5053 domain-containing protein [Candidatus Ornithobacterium hominis]SZD72031.1 Uncharacterised protein [Candidatus Ornithobacterium hominis]